MANEEVALAVKAITEAKMAEEVVKEVILMAQIVGLKRLLK